MFHFSLRFSVNLSVTEYFFNSIHQSGLCMYYGLSLFLFLSPFIFCQSSLITHDSHTLSQPPAFEAIQYETFCPLFIYLIIIMIDSLFFYNTFYFKILNTILQLIKIIVMMLSSVNVSIVFFI